MFDLCAKAQNVHLKGCLIYLQLKSDGTRIQGAYEPVRFVWLLLATFPQQQLLHLLTTFSAANLVDLKEMAGHPRHRCQQSGHFANSH